MESKHQNTSSTVRRSAISVKRTSKEGLERPSKRSRTSLSPSDQRSTPTWSSSSGTSFSGHTDLSGSSGYPQSLSSTTSEENKTSRKRKSTAGETEEGPRKRSRESIAPAEDQQSETRGSVFNEAVHQTSKDNPVSSRSDNPGRPPSVETGPSARRAVFEAKYEQQHLLGEGGFGAVYAGFRKEDNVPVAIKHICQLPIEHTTVVQNGKVCRVPLEVALLQRCKPTASEPCAVVSLLDWFDLGQELVLVLERPTPCMDLFDYLCTREFPLPESEAKIITKQLLDALIDIESRGVFHRDIKLDNILIETGSDVPRVRIIDFGCGTYLSEGFYTSGKGTRLYQPPELFTDGRYMAEPMTVWQLGVVLYAMVHGELPFGNTDEVAYMNPYVSNRLSFCCRHFVDNCLFKDPETRPTLRKLKSHPWLTGGWTPFETSRGPISWQQMLNGSF